jgi:two-component system response regulator HydG
LLTDGDLVEVKSLPFEISNFSKLQFELPVPVAKKDNVQQGTNNQGSFENRLKTANMDAEYEVILNALKQVNFNKSKAAKLLNVDRKTLYNKMKQFKEFNVD